MGKYTQDEINNFLWDAADSQRNTVDSNAFKDYIYISIMSQYTPVKEIKEYGDDPKNQCTDKKPLFKYV